MILTVSHISLIMKKNSFYKDELEGYLKENGFISFNFFPSVKNPQIKRQFCHKFSPFHDLHLWKDKEGKQFEIVYLEDAAEDFVSSFYPIFGCTGFEKSEKEIISSDIRIRTFGNVFGRIYCCGYSSRSGLSGILYETLDMETSLCLWSSLGFTLLSKSPEKAILEFRSLAGKNFNLVLTSISEEKDRSTPGFDQPGLRSIAIIATDIQEVQNRVRKLGFDVTGIDEVTVGRNVFEVSFIFGKNKEIVEILKLSKKKF
ncbi:MAG TPA: hypothetical protein PLO55_11395 [Thermotogota bacterium]|nr:hypothetical protein [Thermotogota bacterium]